MSLLAAARSSLPALRSTAQVALPQMRAMASEAIKGINDAEKYAEDRFFTAEDARLLGKLLQKAKSQSDIVDKHSSAGVKAAEVSALKAIVDKYKISSDDLDKLISWKHTAY